jgi:hypothetical protein
MRSIVSASAIVLLFGLTPVTGATAAAANLVTSVAHGNPAITFVDGWWEQEHHDQDAPQRYWRLKSQQRERYDRLQAEQARRDKQRRQLDEENRRAEEEQHRMLGFEMIIR